MKNRKLFTLLSLGILVFAKALSAQNDPSAFLKKYTASCDLFKTGDSHIRQDSPFSLIIIEDAHSIESVQREIMQIIEHVNSDLTQSGIVPTPLILQEGGSYGAIQTEILKKERTPRELHAFLDQEFTSGALGAAEYLHTRKGGFTFWGIETRELYEKNYTHFMEIASLRSEIKKVIDRFEACFEELRTLIFTEEMKDFYARMSNPENTEDIGEYLETLRLLALQYSIDLKQYPTFSEYFETHAAIRNLNIEKCAQELARFNALNKSSHTLENVPALYSENLITLSDYPLLYSHGKLHTLLLATQMVSFIEDKEKLEHELFQKIAYAEEEKELVSALRKFFIVKKILSFTLTRDEYDYYASIAEKETNLLQEVVLFLKSYFTALEITLPLDTLLVSAENFYRAVDARDEALTENIIKALRENQVPCALLVIGGFHTEGITARLKKKNISFVVLSPRVLELTEESADTYYDVMHRFWNGID
jgi:hypothetical protein